MVTVTTPESTHIVSLLRDGSLMVLDKSAGTYDTIAAPIAREIFALGEELAKFRAPA